MLDILFRSLYDPAYWIQCISAAVFSYTVLDYESETQKKPVLALGKVLLLMLLFLAIHLILSALAISYRFLAGVGTWLAYMGGVRLYSMIFLRKGTNAKNSGTDAASSIIITVIELGAVLGRFLELMIPGFDSVYAKIAACLLLLGAGWVMGKYRINRYYVSPHAARLNSVACAVSAICVMVYDLCTVHIFRFGGDAGLTGLMSVVLLALFVMDIVCYFMTYHLSREHSRVITLTTENQMNKSAQSLMTLTEENLAEIHKLRHDIENQHVYMRAMLDSGDIDGLRNYFDELTSTFAEPLGEVMDCGNHPMNLIFHMETTKARKFGVTMDIKAATPHKLPFSELDLVNLYTNVIDNAIEACVAEAHQNPVVTVTVNVVGEYLFTQIKNPTIKRTSFLKAGLPTTKGDTRTHGKGMSIVRGIVQKYDGSIRYSIVDGKFIVEFMLCLKETTNE